jgi:hypothetical protein
MANRVADDNASHAESDEGVASLPTAADLLEEVGPH